VGRQSDGSVVLPNDQVITPTGRQIMLNGARPNAVAISPDGATAAFLTAACNGCAVVKTVDVKTGKVLAQLNPGKGGGAPTGIVYSADGRHLYASDTAGYVLAADVNADGTLTQQALIPMPTAGGGTAYPEGLALSPDGKSLYVALSRANALGVVDLATQKVVQQIPVGNAPWGVTVDGGSVFVSNEGGRPAQAEDFTNNSSGTNIVADKGSGGAATGTVSVVDVASQKTTASIPVGLTPTSMHLEGRNLFVADTNSDDVSVIDTGSRKVVKTIHVQPFPGAPRGSSPEAVTMLPGGRLAVALGNNNAVAFYHWAGPSSPVIFEGLLPTAWYPGALAVDPALKQLVIANIKGVGSLGNEGSTAKSAYAQVGSASVVDYPATPDLAKGTIQVVKNNGWNRAASAIPTSTDCKGTPQPVPTVAGCSPIKHVFFIIKENRTYDQVLGDMPQGNGNAANTEFGAQVTPNQHALATRFPLLDNYYASGIASDEGHQWLDEAWVTSYLEKMEYGGPERGYPYDGGDALAYAPTGFLWQNATRRGLSVRDYGEFAAHFAGPSGSISNWEDPSIWQQYYKNAQILAGQNSGQLNPPLGTYTAQSDVPSLKNVLSPDYPPFNTVSIPDQYRTQIFLKEFRDYEAHKNLPNLMMFTLPNDHTAGTAPGFPTPQAMIADNDLALGKIVDAISHSPDWKDSAIFVTEDDAQNGVDHVDGHRTTGYVISPYTRTGVDHTYYSQIDMVRTIEQILGLPAMNQFDLAATPMRDTFTSKPNFAPYTAQANRVPLDQLSPSPTSTTNATQSAWANWSSTAFRGPVFTADSPNYNALNRAIWYSVKGYSTPYPGDQKVLQPNEVPPSGD
jgi:YVTN family beta-propeller protein